VAGTGPLSPRVDAVDVEVVRPVRMVVLRAGRPPETSSYDGDHAPLARHIAVSVGDEVLSVGTVFPDAAPWLPERDGAWHIRGMATLDGWRGRGLGHLVLDALIGHATEHGGRLIWCSARLAAVPFYARFGLRVDGTAFVLEGVDHIHMWRDF
jgi:GNAT superfamily N-acetyltransferase